SSRRRHTRFSRDWSSDVCSSDLATPAPPPTPVPPSAESADEWHSAPSPIPRARAETPQAAPPAPERDEWYSSPSSPPPVPPVNVQAAPPAAPAKKRGGLGITALVIAGVLGLMLIACVAGFFLLGGPRLLGLGPGVADVTDEPGSGLVETEAVLPTEAVAIIGESTEPPAPTATAEVQQPTEPAAGGLSSLTINNQASTVICYVRLSPTSSDQWGDDQLGDTETIASGSSFTIWDVPPGEYDYQALDCNQVVLD